MSENRFLRLYVLQAGHGDCLVIEYGDDPMHPHLIIIDGGVGSEATPRLKKLLKGWPEAAIELLVVSHIDDDHIVGAIRLLNDKNLRARIKDIWFNGASKRQAKNLEKLGFKKGDRLEKILGDKTLNLPWNNAFCGADVAVDTSTVNKPVIVALGASITLLSPTVASLYTLREAWAANRLLEEAAKTVETKETQALVGLERMGAPVVPVININDILKTTCDEDGSAANGSSIAFLFSFGDATLLLAADAHANVLLETASSLDGGVPRCVDVLKLPHHGSAANVTTDLLKAFPAKIYVVSTNGNKHEHPDDLAIARIVDTAPGSKVLFNYPGSAYKRWLEFSIENADKLDVDAAKTGDILKIELGVSR